MISMSHSHRFAGMLRYFRLREIRIWGVETDAACGVCKGDSPACPNLTREDTIF